jgi:hypothetical protein
MNRRLGNLRNAPELAPIGIADFRRFYLLLSKNLNVNNCLMFGVGSSMPLECVKWQ